MHRNFRDSSRKLKEILPPLTAFFPSESKITTERADFMEIFHEKYIYRFFP
jgi:hypothetical protein